MGKVTIVLAGVSTVVLLIAFGKGITALHGVTALDGGAAIASHYQWAMATLLTALTANVFAMVHAGQSDRIIRDLRRYIEESAGQKQPAAESE